MSGSASSAVTPRALSRRSRGVRGSAIRDLLTLTARSDVISLAGGLPAPEFIPGDRIAEQARAALAVPGSVQYAETTGLRELRDVPAHRESGRIGRPVDQADIVVTHGSQQALSLSAQVLLDPGDTVVVEAPAYTGALQAFQAAQARVHTVPLDDEGMVTEELRRLLETGLRPAVVHTVSNFHNPRGVVLGESRRHELAALAERYGFWVIEDDPYGDLWFDAAPPPPVAALSDRVLRLSSASKILAPALRVGWLHGDREVCRAVELLKQGADLCGSALTHRIAAGLLADDAWMTAHVDALRSGYGSRARALVGALDDAFGDTLTLSDVRGGMFCWASVAGSAGAETDTARLLDSALAEGVAFVPGAAFGTGEQDLSSSMRLCFATYGEDVLTEAVARLRRAVDRHG